MRKPYEYSGIEAASYDLIDELSDFDDYPFYRFLIESNPGRVLDLGCGTGRILSRLAEEGIEVAGVDSSVEMLDICRTKLSSLGLDVPLEQGDLRSFNLGSKFDTLLIPGFTFQLLLDSQDMDACLDRCLSHLEPAGQLVLPTYFPWEMLDSGLASKPLELRRKSKRDLNGERFIAWQGWEIDRVSQLLHLLNRFQHLDSSGRILTEEDRSMTLRWHMPYDMQCKLQERGFGDISVYGDFAFDPPESDSEPIIYVARR